jgi:protein-S-isoprenylcysteine O-methyltransferase Ste14
MEAAVLVLQLTNLALIGLLPRIFFRPGRLNLRWWLAAAPLFLTAVVLLLAFAEVIAPLPQPDSTLSHAAAVVSVPMSGTSIALIAYAMGSHSAPVSLWHQGEATPGRLVTHGAYGKVRHPFYLAFMLALAAACLFVASPWMWGVAAYGFLAMQVTARGEEKRWLASAHAEAYRRYMDRTGRFMPWLRGTR